MGAIGKPCRGSAALSLAGSPLTRAGDCRWQLPPARSRTERAISVSAHGDFAEGWVLAPGRRDRKSVVEGKSVSVRLDLGGSRSIKKVINIKSHIPIELSH